MNTVKLWRWQQGRQQTTKYSKLPLWSFRIWKWGFDGYILKYPAHTIIDWHRDPVANGEHWRKNWTLKGQSIFYIDLEGVIEVCRKGNYGWFRPDIYKHKVKSYAGCVKLSIGFVKF